MSSKSEIVFQEDAYSETDEQSKEKFSSRQVMADSSDPTISSLMERIADGEIDLHPSFQRGYVWDCVKASRLVESVLLKIPLPVVYLAEEADSRCSVIDGQQRLTSLYSFVRGEFPSGEKFVLRGLTCFDDLNGKSFSRLPTKFQRAIKNYAIRVITFSNGGDPNLKFNVFERLNTGAVALNDQELRNCIYRGRYNELLTELAGESKFRKLLGLKAGDRRMKDIELVLRFAAFYHTPYYDYKPPIKRFLNEEMRSHCDIGEKDAKNLKSAFKNALDLVSSVFGVNQAFKRFYPGKEGRCDGAWETKKFNASLYDILMWTFSRADKNLVMNNIDAIREAYLDLMASDSDFIESIERSTSSSQMVERRFLKWHSVLKKILGKKRRQARCFSLELKKSLFKRNPTCAICGQRISDIDDAAVDHVRQYWCGGETISENARLVHRYCNCARSKFDVVKVPGVKEKEAK